MFAIGKNLLCVSDPRLGTQERLIDADALICLPTLQPQPVVRLHSYTPVERFTVKTVQKVADIAVHVGSRLSTASASSYRALKGYMHECVKQTQQEYARGEVHENCAGCLFSLRKPSLRVFRGVSKGNLSG